MKTFQLDNLIGMSIADAKHKLSKKNFILRVSQQDGKELSGTCEMRGNRVNVAVEDDKIVEIFNIG